MFFLGFPLHFLVPLNGIFAPFAFYFHCQSVDKFRVGSYAHFGPAETFRRPRQNGSMIVCSICDDSYWCDGGRICDCACHDAERELDDVEDDLEEDDFDDDEYDDD